MKRLSIVFLLAFLFVGCSQKELNKVKELPHYNKEKVNLYLLNNETSIGMIIHFKFTIKNKNTQDIKQPIVCYGQYSFLELDEGEYTISAESSEFQTLGKRDDQPIFEKSLKNGNTYILKGEGKTDIKAVSKKLFSPFSFSPDALLSIVELNKEDGIVEFNKTLEYEGGVAGRYSLRAEDNKGDKSCLKRLLEKVVD